MHPFFEPRRTPGVSRRFRRLVVSCAGVALALLPAARTASATPVLAPAAADPVAASSGEQTASLAGQLTAPGGIVVSDGVVQVLGVRRQASVGSDGSFRIIGLPAGEFLVQFTSPRWGQAVRRVELSAEHETRLDVELNLAVHHEAIVVTARSDARSLSDLSQPVSVLSGDELRIRTEATLGETLSQQPGVSSTQFGEGASRPVIRGLGGDRIRILEDGIGAGDVSDTSPDHAVSLDPLSARQIEIVRGPATLLFGSSAVGGVVNVLQDTIPSIRGDRFASASLDLFGGTVSEYLGGQGTLKAGKGPLVVHADFTRRAGTDYDIPGYAESELVRSLEEAEAFGTLLNSAVASTGASVGMSLVGSSGFIGASFAGFDSLFGIPGGGHVHSHEEGEDHEGEEEDHDHGHEGEEEPIRSDLRQRRFDLRGELVEPFSGFQAAKLRFGHADYTHNELEGDAIGTQFNNDAWEGRFELVHQPWGATQGSFGFQIARRELEAIGEEAFLPPTTTDAWALFAFEEIGRGAWRLQLGARYEDHSLDARSEVPDSRQFGGFSGSLGTTWTGPDGWNLGVTLARSARMPTAAELFANGPHLATRAFEIGDPDLDQETSWGFDVTFGKRQGRVTAQLNLFANRFDGYIYEAFTGEVEDGLDVIQFTQADSDFRGGELQGTLDLVHRGSRHLDLEVWADYVWAELRTNGEPLPRIPPFRWGTGLHYRDERWTGRLELRGVASQDRIAENELPTDGYTFLNASIGYRFFTGRTVYDLTLRGTNLTDAEGRNHVSFLKDTVPLPGRDVRLALRVAF